MSVKWEDINVGDKLKIEVDGLASKDWHDVTYKSDLRLVLTGGWTLYKGNEDIAKITAHQPAPRKVEVTLGTPVRQDTRYYDGQTDAQLFTLADCGNGFLNLGNSGHEWDTRSISYAEARHLALDILATVGIED